MMSLEALSSEMDFYEELEHQQHWVAMHRRWHLVETLVTTTKTAALHKLAQTLFAAVSPFHRLCSPRIALVFQGIYTYLDYSYTCAPPTQTRPTAAAALATPGFYRYCLHQHISLRDVQAVCQAFDTWLQNKGAPCLQNYPEDVKTQGRQLLRDSYQKEQQKTTLNAYFQHVFLFPVLRSFLQDPAWAQAFPCPIPFVRMICTITTIAIPILATRNAEHIDQSNAKAADLLLDSHFYDYCIEKDSRWLATPQKIMEAHRAFLDEGSFQPPM